MKKSRFGRFFEAFTFIVEKLTLYSKYESVVVAKQFMDKWFSSDINAFSFAMLIMSFIKNNEEMSTKYFQYLNRQKDTLQPRVVVSHFVTSCMFSGSAASVSFNETNNHKSSNRNTSLLRVSLHIRMFTSKSKINTSSF